jgi:hypothetical protein
MEGMNVKYHSEVGIGTPTLLLGTLIKGTLFEVHFFYLISNANRKHSRR